MFSPAQIRKSVSNFTQLDININFLQLQYASFYHLLDKVLKCIVVNWTFLNGRSFESVSTVCIVHVLDKLYLFIEMKKELQMFYSHY